MPRIPIYTSPEDKSMFHAECEAEDIEAERNRRNKMIEVFSQLSPIDEMRIINKVDRDMEDYGQEDCRFPQLNALIKRLSLAYGYSVEITNSVLI